MHTLKFRLAEVKDIAQLLNIINAAYRQNNENSWTNEALLVEGERITAAQLYVMLQQQHQDSSVQMVIAELNTQADEEIIGCIGLTYAAYDAEIGTFCIAPTWQAMGYGQQVLQAAELYAVKHQSNLKTLTMWVLDVRTELIEYYERRGYIRTGVVEPYPIELDVGKPLVDLKIIQLQKKLDI